MPAIRRPAGETPAPLKVGAIALLLLALVGCDDMTKQKRDGAYTARAGSPAKPVAGTVMRDEAPTAAPPVTLALLQQGRTEFDIYCSACHGMTGAGNGMIVQRGFPKPPDLAETKSPQRVYDAVSNGYGVMFSFAGRIAPQDRWAIAAYVAALQASRHATLADVPADRKGALE
jgi:mono/diheme cytochrome c family protein